MSDAIQGWKDEYHAEVEKLSSLMSSVQSMQNGKGKEKSAEIKDKLAQADERVKRIKEVKKSFGLELRLVKDRQVKQDFDADAKLLDIRVSSLVQDLRAARETQQRLDLGLDSKTGGGAASGGGGASAIVMKDFKGKGNDDLLESAGLLQDLTVQSLGRTTAMIEESKELGTATLQSLHDQRQQIETIDAEVTTIDTNLKRAEKLIANFARRMATDKIIQGFAAVNIVILLGLILYVVISGKSLSSMGGGKDTTPASDPAAAD